MTHIQGRYWSDIYNTIVSLLTTICHVTYGDQGVIHQRVTDQRVTDQRVTDSRVTNKRLTDLQWQQRAGSVTRRQSTAGCW